MSIRLVFEPEELEKILDPSKRTPEEEESRKAILKQAQEMNLVIKGRKNMNQLGGKVVEIMNEVIENNLIVVEELSNSKLDKQGMYVFNLETRHAFSQSRVVNISDTTSTEQKREVVRLINLIKNDVVQVTFFQSNHNHRDGLEIIEIEYKYRDPHYETTHNYNPIAKSMYDTIWQMTNNLEKFLPNDMTKADFSAWVYNTARACHEVNIAYMTAVGSKEDLLATPSWDMLPEEGKLGLQIGVLNSISGISHKKMHEKWMETKIQEGWTYGKEKSIPNKTHHCLVPYEELPAIQRHKDAIFSNTVKLCLGRIWDRDFSSVYDMFFYDLTELNNDKQTITIGSRLVRFIEGYWEEYNNNNESDS